MGAVGRELQIGGRLAIGQLELRQRVRLVSFLGLLLLLRFDARVLDQLLLLGFDELLAVGLARIALARLHVGQLGQLAAVERQEEQVVVAREGHRRFAARPPRIGLVAGRPRHLTARAGDRVEHHDVAAVDEEHAPARRVPPAGHRRRGPAFFVGQLARRAAVAGDGPRRRLVISRTAPFEEQPRRISGPAQAGRRVADEGWTAHDALDGERETSGRFRRLRRLNSRGGGGPGKMRGRCREHQGGEARRGAELKGAWKSIQFRERNAPAERLQSERHRQAAGPFSDGVVSNAFAPTDSSCPDFHHHGGNRRTVSVRFRSNRTVALVRHHSIGRSGPRAPTGRVAAAALDRRGGQPGARTEPRHSDSALRSANPGHGDCSGAIVLGAAVQHDLHEDLQ